MDLGWKIFLPLSLSYLVFVTGILITFDGAPQVLEIEPERYTESFFFRTHVNDKLPPIKKNEHFNLIYLSIKTSFLWETQLKLKDSAELFFNLIEN